MDEFEFHSIADFDDDDIKIVQSLSPLDMLAFIAHKALQKDYPSYVFPDTKPTTIAMPMLERKTLPFNLNLKPRTLRKPRTTPIDVHALFPCLQKNTNSDESSQAPEKRRLTDTQRYECELSRAAKRKRLIAPPPPPQQPVHLELPVEFRHKIEDLGGSDIRFVIQKRLYDADVLANKSRLTMPYRQCKVDFGNVERTRVKVIHKGGNELREIMMTFLRWDTVSSYVFNGSWNDLVMANGLHKDDVVQVWSFKLRDAFAFALIKL